MCIETTESLGDYRKRLYEQRVRKWKKKQLHGAFARDTEAVAAEDSLRWMRNRYLKKEIDRNDLCSAGIGPKNQLCQMPHR